MRRRAFQARDFGTPARSRVDWAAEEGMKNRRRRRERSVVSWLTIAELRERKSEGVPGFRRGSNRWWYKDELGVDIALAALSATLSSIVAIVSRAERLSSMAEQSGEQRWSDETDSWKVPGEASGLLRRGRRAKRKGMIGHEATAAKGAVVATVAAAPCLCNVYAWTGRGHSPCRRHRFRRPCHAPRWRAATGPAARLRGYWCLGSR